MSAGVVHPAERHDDTWCDNCLYGREIRGDRPCKKMRDADPTPIPIRKPIPGATHLMIPSNLPTVAFGVGTPVVNAIISQPGYHGYYIVK